MSQLATKNAVDATVSAVPAECCRSCFFYRAIRKQGNLGQAHQPAEGFCQRNPPTTHVLLMQQMKEVMQWGAQSGKPGSGQVDTLAPVVPWDHWCGEYKPAKPKADSAQAMQQQGKKRAG